MKKILLSFPPEVRDDIAGICENGGILFAEQCKRICQQLNINLSSLMIRLLPLAARHAKALISSCQVGAVASAVIEKGEESANLYLGANVEFMHQALSCSIHAEQAAISNAWLSGETGIGALAISASPCGHCRQFLYEVASLKTLPIFIPASRKPVNILGDFKATQQAVSGSTIIEQNLPSGFIATNLSQLLPVAFGPLDLACKHFLMEAAMAKNKHQLIEPNDDDLVDKALQAANLSYAPYTLNFSGCALKLTSGEIFCGRYAENAAFNPSLSPFAVAMSKLMLRHPDFKESDLERLVLVECPTMINQKQLTQNLLAACNREIKLEYHEAVRTGHEVAC